jgi:hypothetical protein
MFVWHEVPLALGYPAAKEKFTLLVHGGWLDGVSQDAYSEGISGLLRVGPFGRVPGLSKQVRLQLLEPVPHDDELILPIRWEATGAMTRLFPVLDANLALARAADGRAVLRLAGSYRPPLDGVGVELDQLALHRVADATIRALLQRIAGTLDETAASEKLGPEVQD